MPTAGYLRTNMSRRGIVQMDGLGGAIAKASVHGGAGTETPYGGFIFMSLCGPIMEATAAASLAGISSRAVFSTVDIMASFYGAGIYPAGYAFHPVVAYCHSMASGADFAFSLQGNNDSIWNVVVTSFRHSGSYAIWTPLVMLNGGGGASQFSFISLSYCSANWTVGGFICSGPGY